MFLFEIQQFELPSFHSAWHHNRNAISLKKSLSSWFSAVWPFQVLEVMFMHTRTYASSWGKRNSFYRKSELRMFLLISCGHISAPKQYTNMASPYKALQSCVKHFGKQLRICGPQRSETWTNCLYTCIGTSFITFHFLDFFHWTVPNLLFFFANLGVWTDFKHSIHFFLLLLVPDPRTALKKHSFLFPFSLLKNWGKYILDLSTAVCPDKKLFSFLFLFYTKF